MNKGENIQVHYGYQDPDSQVLISKGFPKKEKEIIKTHIRNFDDLDTEFKNKEWRRDCRTQAIIVDKYFFEERKYISKVNYRMIPDTMESLPVGTYDDKGEHGEKGKFYPFLDAQLKPIFVLYQEEAFRSADIMIPIKAFTFKNVLGLLKGYLINFMKFNGLMLKSELNDVLASALGQLEIQLDMQINPKFRISLVEDAIEEFEIISRNVPDVSLVEQLEWYAMFNDRHYYVGNIEGYNHLQLIGACINVHDREDTDALVNNCIDNMKDSAMFIDAVRVKENLYSTGYNQILRMVNKRKDEIKAYNLDIHGVISYKKYYNNNQ